ncbi:hypothetical protein E0493_06295 [Roseomonas sp. M0104]|uniref:Phage holin family protein n=1 Tax=Teichococcus coralli TaxID=2545983 RepID=A0A845B702_9PROT|nr:hypothetical protein [Pseudoroseomonas coralli]MXP62961.1 hypothetical protein [Pseudoroseomonas coralli]
MRAFRLAAAAWEAERVLLGLQARRMVGRAVLGAIAAILLCAAFAMAHVLIWFALEGWSPLARAAWLTSGDLVVAVILLMLALRDRPTAQEIEARLLRDTAMAQARASVGLVPLLGSVARSSWIGVIAGLVRRRRAPR